VRYQVRVDGGVNPETVQRQQIRRRYLTEAEARRALAGIADQALAGRFVARKTVTVEQVCDSRPWGKPPARRGDAGVSDRLGSGPLTTSPFTGQFPVPPARLERAT
jgi:hypothetical protein